MAVALRTVCVVSYKEGSVITDPFEPATLYAPLLARAIELCREKHMPADMAEDFVQETYVRFSAVGDGGHSREQTYHWLRTTLQRLVEDARRRRPSVVQLWASAGDESLEELGEAGL